jgi:hypothetical protein
MPEYNNSKIYAIKSTQANKYYIGATTKRLCQRIAQHKQNYNKFVQNLADYDSSFDILQFSDAQIQLLESFECKNKDELNAKLQTYMSSYKDHIVNKPKEKKLKPKVIRKKKEEKKIEEIKNEVIISNTEIQTDSEYESSDEPPQSPPSAPASISIPKEEPKKEEIKPAPLFLNRLQYMRNSLIL